MGGRIYRQGVAILVMSFLGAGTAWAQEEKALNLGNLSVHGDRSEREDVEDTRIERPEMRRDSISFETKPDAPKFDLGSMGGSDVAPSEPSKKRSTKPEPQPQPRQEPRSRPEPEADTGRGSSGKSGASASVENRPLKPLEITAPNYPRRAVKKKLDGEVTVAFTVNEAGRTEDIEVVDADPPNVFNREAIRAVRKWTFKPAISNGSPQRERVRQTIQFDLDR